ncbi:MAG: hypothetical protein LBG06_10080, partial [Deltaproteobacteria bacterium]|nr:hypothetical protein [Deltaproteobacteria bacterium]
MKGRGEGGSGGEIPAGAEAGRPAEKAGASACGKARRPAAWAEEGPPAGGRKAPPAGAGTGGAEAKPAPGAGREAAKGRVQVSLRNGRRYASHHLYVGGKGGRKGLQAFYLGKVIDLERGIFLHAERGLFSYDVERGFGEAAIGPAPPGTEGLAASIAARESRGGGLGRIQVSERANSSYACHVMSYRDGNRSGHRMFYLGKVLDLGRGVFVHTKRGVFSYDIARGFGEEAVSPAPAGFEDAAARLLGGGRRRPEAGGPGWRRRRAAEDGESSFATVPLPTPWKAAVRFGDVWLFDRIAGDSGLKAAVIETLG